MTSGLDVQEVIKRMLKYLVEGIIVALAAHWLPQGKHKLSFEDSMVIGITAAATFAILDMYSPSISSAARTGAGFGIGANLTGFPRV
jgi:hypothetical protein